MMRKLIVTVCILVSIPLFMANVWLGVAFVAGCWVWID